MKQVIIRQGQAVVEEVPVPQLEPGTVLVRVDHSCISIGTEMSGVRSSGQPLWKRAIQQPQNVKKVLQMVATQGVFQARNALQAKLATGNPTGYSAAGVVAAVGDHINDLKIGDRVACAGNQFAHHAEFVRVPRNLVAQIPGVVEFSAASTVTLGAIALQGVRRANPTLGETFVVIGLGILGQLTAQLLRANGCRVIGIDVDRTRIRLATELGLTMGVHPDDGSDVDQIARLTDGVGADGVILTAASSSDSLISSAFQMCRRKGRVVLVGDVGLNLNRADFYQKELDFFISTSYGPGRYDDNYEEKGLDYPVAYVRWTENRNMTEYLRLLAQGNVNVQPLISATYPVDQAIVAYKTLEEGGESRPLMVLLTYPHADPAASPPARRIANPAARPAGSGVVRMAVIGAGGFAKGTHLPNLQALSDRYHLQAVVSRTGHNAMATAKQFGANYASTDYQDVLADSSVDAVLIATRHNLHAGMALEALRAGKHVLVEKPLALDAQELSAIAEYYSGIDKEAATPVLLTGFNRRFSPYIRRIHELVVSRSNPMILNYRMNAGYIPLDHWVHSDEGGGRNRGEACHIYDVFTYLTGAKVVDINARSIRPATGHYSSSDNFVTTMTFEDGSVATLTYSALGTKDYPKERLEVFVDGKVLSLDDYKKLTICGARTKGVDGKVANKGQKEELEIFADCIRRGGEWPIPLWQQIQATEIALRVEESIN